MYIKTQNSTPYIKLFLLVTTTETWKKTC